MKYQSINKETFPQLFESPLYTKILSLIGTGRDEGIHVREISRAADLDERSVRKAIETIRRAGVVIVTDCLSGYWYPDTLEELRLYIRQEERRGKSTFYTLKSARKLYKQCIEEASE